MSNEEIKSNGTHKIGDILYDEKTSSLKIRPFICGPAHIVRNLPKAVAEFLVKDPDTARAELEALCESIPEMEGWKK